jgi:hypothetical protein
MSTNIAAQIRATPARTTGPAIGRAMTRPIAVQGEKTATSVKIRAASAARGRPT